jgi:cupin 2 domain-containing protein
LSSLSGRAGNFYSPVEHGTDEHVDVLVARGELTIERIVSMGHASPADFWYDSPRAEWVLLLSGAARLEFEGEPTPYAMRAGDYVLIDAHRRHRVAWTDPDTPSVWLAIYHSADLDNAEADRR